MSEIINDLHGLVPGKYRENNFAGGSQNSDAGQGPPNSESWSKTVIQVTRDVRSVQKQTKSLISITLWPQLDRTQSKIIFLSNEKLTSKTDRQLRLKIRVKGSEWNR